jgi:hypothetical protein
MPGDWILPAWERISSESIVNGFKCCISNVLDADEDDFVWQDEEYKESDCEENVVVVVMMMSKVRMKTLNNNLSFQKML